ncbi:hypothetical protein J6590_032723 [Homalodisca vitripennis]|nr:hypothetical protein J6590_032723 [Homalodisca vitripennis]
MDTFILLLQVSTTYKEIKVVQFAKRERVISSESSTSPPRDPINPGRQNHPKIERACS